MDNKCMKLFLTKSAAHHEAVGDSHAALAKLYEAAEPVASKNHETLAKLHHGHAADLDSLNESIQAESTDDAKAADALDLAKMAGR
jgi:hypothetical protein